jgi:hypothetical protein
VHFLRVHTAPFVKRGRKIFAHIYSNMHKKNLWKESQEIDKLCPVGNYLKGWR